MRIILVGFGNVGQGFVTLLNNRYDSLHESYDFAPQVVGVVTRSRGALYHAGGLDLHTLANLSSPADYPDSDGLERGLSTLEMIARGADVLVEVSPTNLQTGQPALEMCINALQNGLHVVTANKGPIAVGYEWLEQAAQVSGKRVLFEGTVMAGTPSIRLAQEALAGTTISRARGILNGTTNYILTQMEAGMSYADALAQAQTLGYAETDPTADVDGWDAASKVLILANAVFGAHLTLDDLDVSGISHLTDQDITSAAQAGERWKLIATATPHSGSVKAVRLPISDPLAGVSGATNAITYDTDILGAVTLVGTGAGRQETGYAILADLLALHE